MFPGLAPLVLLLAAALSARSAPNEPADRELLQRVAQSVLAQTTRRLVDRGTDETFTASSRLRQSSPRDVADSP